jgi:hypothetical protein
LSKLIVFISVLIALQFEKKKPTLHPVNIGVFGYGSKEKLKNLQNVDYNLLTSETRWHAPNLLSAINRAIYLFCLIVTYWLVSAKHCLKQTT